jgi:hypothetical protein
LKDKPRRRPAIAASRDGDSEVHVALCDRHPVNARLADSKMKSRFAELGATTFGGSPSDFARHIADETEKGSQTRCRLPKLKRT